MGVPRKYKLFENQRVMVRVQIVPKALRNTVNGGKIKPQHGCESMVSESQMMLNELDFHETSE